MDHVWITLRTVGTTCTLPAVRFWSRLTFLKDGQVSREGTAGSTQDMTDEVHRHWM